MGLKEKASISDLEEKMKGLTVLKRGYVTALAALEVVEEELSKTGDAEQLKEIQAVVNELDSQLSKIKGSIRMKFEVLSNLN